MTTITKKITKIENLNINEITFTTPRNNKNNAGKSVYVNNVNKLPLRIQTPKMTIPFGISKWDASGPVRYNLDLSFNNLDETVYDNFKEFQEKFVGFATDHSAEFFKKQMQHEVVQAFYTSAIRPNPFEDNAESKYAPTIRCKLDKNEDGEFRTEVWDGNNLVNGEYQKIKLTEDNYEEVLPKGCQVQVILSCSGWVVNGKFGLMFRAEQIKVFNSNNKLNGFAFDEDNEDETGTDSFTVEDTTTEENTQKVETKVVDKLAEDFDETVLVDEEEIDTSVKKTRGRAARK